MMCSVGERSPYAFDTLHKGPHGPSGGEEFMSWLTKLRSWFGTSAKIQARARRSSARARLGVELLEARALMNSPPTLAAVPDQIFHNGSVTLTLVGSDADNDPLTYFASPLLMGQAYQLDQQFGLTFPGSYYTNFQGH